MAPIAATPATNAGIVMAAAAPVEPRELVLIALSDVEAELLVIDVMEPDLLDMLDDADPLDIDPDVMELAPDEAVAEPDDAEPEDMEFVFDGRAAVGAPIVIRPVLDATVLSLSITKYGV